MDITSFVIGKKAGGGGGSIPEYEGSYSVTPSTSAQTLATNGKAMTDDVTVAAMPQGSATTPKTVVQVTPSIRVDSNEQGGFATVVAEVNIHTNPAIQVAPNVVPGYVAEGTSGEVFAIGSNFLSLDTVGTRTYTPTTTDQTIAKNRWLTGVQTIKGDQNLVPGNIKKDVTVFNVTGTFAGGSSKTAHFTPYSPTVSDSGLTLADFYNTMDGTITDSHICYGLLEYNYETKVMICTTAMPGFTDPDYGETMPDQVQFIYTASEYDYDSDKLLAVQYTASFNIDDNGISVDQIYAGQNSITDSFDSFTIVSIG